MAENLILYDETGVTPVTSFAFADSAPGIPSEILTFRLVNDDSASTPDTAPNPLIYVLLEQDGVAIDRGARPVDERWVRAWLTGVSSSGIEQLPTPPTPLGRGSKLLAVAIPAGEWVELKVQEFRPGGATVAQTSYQLEWDGGALYTSLEMGHSESGRDGVLTGLGDDTWSEILRCSDVVAQGTPDDTVQIPDVLWRPAADTPTLRALLTYAETIDDEDDSTVALSSGEEYWCLLTLSPAGAVVQTKSDLDTAPIADDDRPATPAGHDELALVRRKFGTEINDGDITQLWDVGGFGYSIDVLAFTVHAGRAIVSNSLIRRTGATTFGLTDDATTHVWLLPNGEQDITEDGSRPSPLALLLYVVVAAGGVVTSVTDMRPWIGGESVELVFTNTAEITGGQTAIDFWQHERPGIIWPFGMGLALHDPGAGNSTGQVALDLAVSDGAGGWDSIYPASGSDDRRVVVDEADAEPVSRTDVNDLDTLPTEFLVPALRRLRATFVEKENYDVDNPTGATARVTVFLV